MIPCVIYIPTLCKKVPELMLLFLSYLIPFDAKNALKIKTF